MKKFNVFVGIENEDVQFEKNLEFPNYEEAMKYAELWAYEIYYMNPKLDILEIMRELDVTEDVATILFIKQMTESINYSVEEVVEGE